MPKKSNRAISDHTVHITVPVDGWLKNELIDLAEKSDISFQRLVNLLLANGVRDYESKPALVMSTPPDPISSVVSYLKGERRLEPCGQVSCNKQPVCVLDSTYCDTCGVRLE